MPRPRKTNLDLPTRVFLKHGAYYWCYQGKWHPLGRDREKALALARHAFFVHAISGHYTHDEVEIYVSRLVRGAKMRAKRWKLEFALSDADITDLLNASNGCCMVTGTPFRFDRVGPCRKLPYAPSIDRIDSAKGYVRENCRLVCAAVNYAMGAWGEDVLDVILRYYGAKKRAERTRLLARAKTPKVHIKKLPGTNNDISAHANDAAGVTETCVTP